MQLIIERFFFPDGHSDNHANDFAFQEKGFRGR